MWTFLLTYNVTFSNNQIQKSEEEINQLIEMK